MPCAFPIFPSTPCLYFFLYAFPRFLTVQLVPLTLFSCHLNIRHDNQVKFSDPALKDKRVIMTYLVGTMRIFGDASIGAVFDGESGFHTVAREEENQSQSINLGQANLYVHGAKVFDSQDFPVSESEAKGRPQNPKFPSNKNLIVTVSGLCSFILLPLFCLCSGLHASHSLNISSSSVYPPSSSDPLIPFLTLDESRMSLMF